MHGRRNTLAGRAYEYELVTEFNQLKLFPELGRSAEINPELDGMMFDIIPKNPNNSEGFKYMVQAKTSTKSLDYSKLFEKMDRNSTGFIPIIFHKKTERLADDRFSVIGRYGIMKQDDILQLIQAKEQYERGYRMLMDYWDSLPEYSHKDLNEQLIKIGL
jgi:hypothetical protein